MRAAARYTEPSRPAALALAALLLAGLVALALPLPVERALAAAIADQRPLLFKVDGSDTTAGQFGRLNAVALDYASGDLYVVDTSNFNPEDPEGSEAVCKLDSEGNAKSFPAGPAAGTSCLLGPSSEEAFKDQNQFFFSLFVDVAVDNSGGAGGSGEGEQGRLYVSGSGGPIDAFDSEGNFLWTIPRSATGTGVRGITVDVAGHLWVGTGSGKKVLEFDTTGAGPPSTTPIDEVPIESGAELPARLGIDRSGADLYVAHAWNFGGPPTPGTDKYVEGVFDSAVTATPTRNLAVDQSLAAGHIFALHQNAFQEFEPCSAPGCGGTEVPGSPFGADLLGAHGGGSGGGSGIAHNPSLDRVYVSDSASNTLKVFGPPASGTAPDVASEETDEIKETEATAHATINPREVANSYHFEWIRGEAQRVSVEASGGTFRLSTGGFPPEFTDPMPFDVSPEAMQAELEGLYGTGNVSVRGTPTEGPGLPGVYDVVFEGELAGRDVAGMVLDFTGLEGDSRSLSSVRTVTQGQSWTSATNEKRQSGEPEWPESYPSIEPPDSTDHAVSHRLEGLARNTTYHVRLVGTATEPEGDPAKRLNSYASPPDTFTTLPPDPPTVEGLGTSAITPTSARLAATIDPQEDETTWRALLSTEVEAGAGPEACEGLAPSAFELAAEDKIPSGELGTVEIAADLTGLEHRQTYCLRVIATNANPKRAEADTAFRTLAVPPGEAEVAFAAPRTDTTARLNARVNPQGEAPLAYRFEVSTDGVEWTPLETLVSTTEAREPIVIAQEASGLTPDTTYHYRLGLLESTCPPAEGCGPAVSLGGERTFATRTAAESTGPTSCPANEDARAKQHTDTYLPDCRGLELVNNPEKGEKHVLMLEPKDKQLAPGGGKLIWQLEGGGPGGHSPEGVPFLATRTGRSAAAPTGWRSVPLQPPPAEQFTEGQGGVTPAAFTPDFSTFILAEGARLQDGGEVNSFLSRWRPGQTPELLAHFPGSEPELIDVSDDGAHVITVNPETEQLEDLGRGEPGEPLGVMPDGGPSKCGVSIFGGFSSAFGAFGRRMMAADASRVYFFAKRDGACGVTPQPLYLRDREANGGAGRTFLIDPGSGSLPGTADFLHTSSDGRLAYFVTPNRCRSWREEEAPEPPRCEAPEAADEGAGADVYRWDAEAGESECLTCGFGRGGEKVAANVLLARVSADLSHLYFESEAALLPGTVPGHDYLYVLSGGQLRLAADITGVFGGFGVGLRPARLSADGEVLLFATRPSRRLTADPVALSCEAPCVQLYRYEEADRSLECVSCRRGGETLEPVRFAGDAGFALSRDGSTIAFSTLEALAPSDVNRAADAYAWREGRIALLSDGVTEFTSESLLSRMTGPSVEAIDADGTDIFFSVVAPGLTGFEADSLRNLYDARIDGGFPPPTPPAHCTEDSCQGPLVAPPALPQIASRTESRGNVAERSDCRRVARRARGLSRRARSLRRAARASDRRRARPMRRRAARLAERARRLSKRARRCRRANRRAAR